MSGEQILFLTFFAIFFCGVGFCGLVSWMKNKIQSRILQRETLEMEIAKQRKIIANQQSKINFYELEVDMGGLR